MILVRHNCLIINWNVPVVDRSLFREDWQSCQKFVARNMSNRKGSFLLLLPWWYDIIICYNVYIDNHCNVHIFWCKPSEKCNSCITSLKRHSTDEIQSAEFNITTPYWFAIFEDIQWLLLEHHGSFALARRLQYQLLLVLCNVDMMWLTMVEALSYDLGCFVCTWFYLWYHESPTPRSRPSAEIYWKPTSQNLL